MVEYIQACAKEMRRVGLGAEGGVHVVGIV